MKTPEQIADDLLTALDLGDVPEGAPKTDADMSNTFRSGWMEGAQVRDWLIQAVKADRAQRAEGSPLIAAVADALEDRGAVDAARLVRDTDPEDDLWNYIGPMLDEIEADYGALAAGVER